LVSVARFDIQVQKTACPPPLRPFALSTMELTSVADPVAAKSEINIINCDDAKKEEKDAAPQEEKEPGTIILFWLCCVSALEGMDTQLVLLANLPCNGTWGCNWVTSLCSLLCRWF